MTKINLGSKKNLQQFKVNINLELVINSQLIELLEFKDIFAWTYKDLKGIPLEIVQHWIELDTSISPTHQARYRLNLNYLAIVKHDIDKLLATCFIKPIEEATWLSPIVVIPKKNGKFIICVDFIKFNVATKKDPYLLPSIDEVINTIAGHEVYTFLNDFSKYHQISKTLEDQYKTTLVTDWGAFGWV